MCGEHNSSMLLAMASTGSSPHVRGAQVASGINERDTGIIPACAGSTSHYQKLLVVCRDHPRMCGEHAKVPRVSRLQ